MIVAALKRLITILIVIAAVWSGAAKNTDGIPPAPNPPRLVNDFAGILTSDQIQEKENRLVAFNDSTTNGVVLLLKPRNETSGEVYIAVGYDLEAAIPDAIAKRIIETKMMPALREGDYNAAIDSALAYILPLAAGEISVERLYDDSGSTASSSSSL